MKTISKHLLDLSEAIQILKPQEIINKYKLEKIPTMFLMCHKLIEEKHDYQFGFV